MRWVTFYYDLLGNHVSALKVHDNKEDALVYFNKHCKDFFQLNSQFKADKLPASYGYPMRKFYGISARAFKKMFNSIADYVLDELMKKQKDDPDSSLILPKGYELRKCMHCGTWFVTNVNYQHFCDFCLNEAEEKKKADKYRYKPQEDGKEQTDESKSM